MRCTTLLALLTGVILYLVMGALVFSALEGPNENKAYEKLLDVKHTFLGNETCVTELDFLKLVKVSDTTNILFLVDVHARYECIFLYGNLNKRQTNRKWELDLHVSRPSLW